MSNILKYFSQQLWFTIHPHTLLISSMSISSVLSDIKAEDAHVKGGKKGKGKKDKKKLPVETFGKKKPKLDELKVQNS